MSDAFECGLECRGLVLQPHRGANAAGLELNATLCLAMYLAALQNTFICFVHYIDIAIVYDENQKNNKQCSQ